MSLVLNGFNFSNIWREAQHKDFPLQLPVSLSLLGKMSRVSKHWHAIADLAREAIMDRLGAQFIEQLCHPDHIQFNRPYDTRHHELFKRVLSLHTKIYPKADPSLFLSCHQKRMTLPVPSRTKQLTDLYMQITVKAYFEIDLHPNLNKDLIPLIGSLRAEDIALLKQVNEAQDFIKVWKTLADICNIESTIEITTLETLLAVPKNLTLWCTNNAAALEKVEDIDMQENYLSYLPDIFEFLPNLTSLELRENQISQLPESIGKLTKLVYLSLIRNSVTELPDSMRNLGLLKMLYLDVGNLSKLPDWLGELKNLVELRINYNHLRHLPEAIGDLPELYTLEGASNMLNTIPSAIGKLKNLRNLDLQDNNLDSIPSSIKNLENLETLELLNNKLKLDDLPLGFWNLKKVSCLTVTGYNSFREQRLDCLESLENSCNEFRLL